MITAHTIHHRHEGTASYTISLTYEDRFLRRKKLVTDCGVAFVLDLEQTTSLYHGDHIVCADGTCIMVQAKPETLAKITGGNLLELAWHIGNRHTPCQIANGFLLIQHDHVIEHLVEHLGGVVSYVQEPFTPLGGAYGHGRTHSHDHGASTHVHTH
jgi:urease accessory protein